jgi:hypothetical protein
MRGSPLLRTVFLVIALIMVGWVFIRVTAPREHPPAQTVRPHDATPATRWTADFLLRLSADAESITVATRSGIPVELTSAGASHAGTVDLDSADPWVDVQIIWKPSPDTGPAHRFAKITIEIPGRPTFKHVIDGRGDLDERIELPPANAS